MKYIPIPPETLGELLKNRMIEKNIHYLDLAKKVGVSERQIRRYINGDVKLINYVVLFDLMSVLEIKVEEILK